MEGEIEGGHRSITMAAACLPPIELSSSRPCERRHDEQRGRENDGGGGIGDREETRVFVAGEERTGGKRGKERERRQEEALSWRHVLRGRQSLLV